MSLAVSRTKLMEASRDLRLRWDQVRTQWNDPVADEFDRRHLEPLEALVRSAVTALENTGQVMARAQAECA